MLRIQEDKENSVVPQTPLLQKNSNQKSKSLSPGKRLPFGNKDNNVSRNLFSNISKQGKLGPPTRGPGKNSNDTKRLKKYGSILGVQEIPRLNRQFSNVLPRTKSLVLKDDEDASEEDSEGNDENDSNPMRLKLRGVIGAKQDKYDRDIEHKSVRGDILEDIPVGYTPFTDEQLSKLSEYHPRDVFIEEEEDKDEPYIEKSPELLPLNLDIPLELDFQEPEQITHEPQNEQPIPLPLDIDTSLYNGEGLDDADIEDLINGV